MTRPVNNLFLSKQWVTSFTCGITRTYITLFFKKQTLTWHLLKYFVKEAMIWLYSDSCKWNINENVLKNMAHRG